VNNIIKSDDIASQTSKEKTVIVSFTGNEAFFEAKGIYAKIWESIMNEATTKSTILNAHDITEKQLDIFLNELEKNNLITIN
jgi:hypothetical protein